MEMGQGELAGLKSGANPGCCTPSPASHWGPADHSQAPHNLVSALTITYTKVFSYVITDWKWCAKCLCLAVSCSIFLPVAVYHLEHHPHEG